MADAQRGDADAYDRLLHEILPELRGFVNARMRNLTQSDDVVQNVLLSIHRSRHTYRPERPFGPWMRAVARNAVVDAFRSNASRAKREEPLEHHEPFTEDVAPIETQPLSPRVVAALDTLSPTQREAVELLHLRELPLREAAELAGVTPNALKVRAHRARQVLKTRLGATRLEGIDE